MKILICGATGFVGRHLTAYLRNAGHDVTRAIRHPAMTDDIAVDFSKDTAKSVWVPRLKGYDAVINAVGLLRDSTDNPMRNSHADTPAALFSAAVEAGVGRIIHLSALGVDSGIDTTYFSTKLLAERSLQALPPQVRWLCLRPSVIYGDDGASAKMFRAQARLPLHILLAGGRQTLQPVHIDDVSAAVERWLSDSKSGSQIVAAAGAEATTMRGMLDSYRQQLGHGSALHISMPSLLTSVAARIGDHLPASPLCSDTLKMLTAGSIADSTAFSELLGHPPQSYREFLKCGRATLATAK
ncbi:MAG: NAD-dependent epimerase/dehydratase family protein [Gallionella sp.]